MAMGRRAVVPLLALGFAAIFAGPAVFSSKTVYVGDLGVFERPRDRLLARSLTEGEGIPRWTPDIYGGVSAIAAQEMALLYPPNVVLALVPRGLEIGLLLHLAFAAVGAYALARSLGLGERAALLAAAVYGSSGAILSIHHVVVYVRTASWLPWILAGCVRESTWLTALAFLGTYLGGDPLGCVFGGVVALAAGRPLTLVKAAPLAILLGAAQLGPAVGFFPENSRQGGYEAVEAQRFSLWPPELVGFVVPFFFGTHGDPKSLWYDAVLPHFAGVPVELENRRPWFDAIYVGPIAVALASQGALVPGDRRLKRIAFALLAFLPFALGRFAPTGTLLHLVLPVFRFPAKLVLPATLGIALLAARGLELRPRRELLVGLAVLGGLLLVASNLVTVGVFADSDDGKAAAERLAPRIAHAAFVALGGVAILARGRRKALALLLLVAIDLAFALHGALLLGPRGVVDAAPHVAPILRELEARDGVPARVFPTNDARMPTHAEAEEAEIDSTILGEVRQGLDPDSGLGDGVRSQIGFLSSHPLRYVLITRETTRLLTENKIDRARGAVLQGARYILGAANEGNLGDLVQEVDGRLLMKLRDAAPWAAVYRRVGFAQDLKAACAAFHSMPDVPVIEGVAPTAVFDGPPVPARLVAPFTSNRFELEAEGPGWLVVREAHGLGWTATVDDQRVPVQPADIAFRAVFLGEGRHHVTFQFRAPYGLLGALVSALTAAAALGWIVVNRKRARV
ncbi:MAG TPA: YfhO family protein [Planctomycetota bacterium]|nr:YfhO family protein [Planctomycetota bacterium]